MSTTDPIDPIQRRVDRVRAHVEAGTDAVTVVHELLLVVEAMAPLLRQLEMARLATPVDRGQQ